MGCFWTSLEGIAGAETGKRQCMRRTTDDLENLAYLVDTIVPEYP
jgi:hypothetical protein